VLDFANDELSSFNYSHDPLAEYLQFVDNGDFSVDGVLSDFPITASEAIGALNIPIAVYIYFARLETVT
jgi:hypothetical protein